MTPAQFKAVRDKLGLSQADLAAIWGMGHASGLARIGRWERGVHPIDPIAAYAIALMVKQQEAAK